MATTEKAKQGVQMANAVSNYVNSKYNLNYPIVDIDTFKDLGGDFARRPFEEQNKWISVWYDLVVMQKFVNNRAFESYFKKLRKGETTGQIQLSAVDLIEAKKYTPDADAEDYFEDAKARIETQYLNNIKPLKYALSINSATMQTAFLTPELLMDAYDSQITALNNSAENDDIRLTKGLIEASIEKGNVYIYPLATPKDRDTSLAFTRYVKKFAGDMAVEMQNKYNAGHFYTRTPKEYGLMLTTTDIAAIADVYSLSWMFNKQLSDLREDGLFMEMSSEGLKDGNVYAVYMDTDALQIRNFVGFPRTATEFFGNTLTEKRWLHTKVMYNINFFANMIAFADPSSVGLTAATLKTRNESTNANRGEKITVLVDTITVSDGKIGDKFGTFEISGNTDSTTHIDKNSGYLVIGKNESGTSNKITVKWTSHLNSSITATLEITINQ